MVPDTGAPLEKYFAVDVENPGAATTSPQNVPVRDV
jgi:hypothetical protein